MTGCPVLVQELPRWQELAFQALSSADTGRNHKPPLSLERARTGMLIGDPLSFPVRMGDTAS